MNEQSLPAVDGPALSEGLGGWCRSATTITDKQIDAIFNAMPDGAAGFLKTWGYRNFARQVLMENEASVLAEVARERERQDRKFGGPGADDARKSPADWVYDIVAYATWAGQMHRMGAPEKYRRRMRQVAALAVAACESYDRREDWALGISNEAA